VIVFHFHGCCLVTGAMALMAAARSLSIAGLACQRCGWRAQKVVCKSARKSFRFNTGRYAGL
jgi:hypothetical protein